MSKKSSATSAPLGMKGICRLKRRRRRWVPFGAGACHHLDRDVGLLDGRQAQGIAYRPAPPPPMRDHVHAPHAPCRAPRRCSWWRCSAAARPGCPRCRRSSMKNSRTSTLGCNAVRRLGRTHSPCRVGRQTATRFHLVRPKVPSLRQSLDRPAGPATWAAMIAQPPGGWRMPPSWRIHQRVGACQWPCRNTGAAMSRRARCPASRSTAALIESIIRGGGHVVSMVEWHRLRLRVHWPVLTQGKTQRAAEVSMMAVLLQAREEWGASFRSRPGHERCPTPIFSLPVPAINDRPGASSPLLTSVAPAALLWCSTPAVSVVNARHPLPLVLAGLCEAGYCKTRPPIVRNWSLDKTLDDMARPACRRGDSVGDHAAGELPPRCRLPPAPCA